MTDNVPIGPIDVMKWALTAPAKLAKRALMAKAINLYLVTLIPQALDAKSSSRIETKTIPIFELAILYNIIADANSKMNVT